MQRGKPLNQSSSAARPAAAKKRSNPVDDIPAAVRAVVLARAAGQCEACALRLPEKGTHLHHLLRREIGGHAACNLVALHPLCHVLDSNSVHLRRPWAQSRGLILRSWQTPGEVPVTLGTGRIVLLHPTEPLYLDPPGGPRWAAA